MLQTFYSNKEIVIYLFQIDLPNGLFITVSKCRVMTGVLMAWSLK